MFYNYDVNISTHICMLHAINTGLWQTDRQTHTETDTRRRHILRYSRLYATGSLWLHRVSLKSACFRSAVDVPNWSAVVDCGLLIISNLNSLNHLAILCSLSPFWPHFSVAVLVIVPLSCRRLVLSPFWCRRFDFRRFGLSPFWPGTPETCKQWHSW